MEDKKHIRTVVLVLAILAMTGCSTLDTPYDPDIRRGETLFDQIPNQENREALVCAGSIPQHKRKPYQTGRCG